MMGNRSGVTFGLIAALAAGSVCAVTSAPSPVSAAGGEFILVEGPNRYFLDASNDARKVVTGTINGGGNMRLVDWESGVTEAPLPQVVAVSGDGTMMFLTALDPLDPVADTDMAPDIYRIPVGGGPATLMTPGYSGVFFTTALPNDDGSLVLTTGTVGNSTSRTAYLTDGTINSPIMLGATTVSTTYGISGDGRYIVFLAGAGLHRRDLTTGETIALDLGTNGQPVTINGTVVSDDGQCVAMLSAGQVLRDCNLTAPGVEVLATSTASAPPQYPVQISISANGQVVTWLANSPTLVSGVEQLAPQAFRSVNGGPPELISAPATGLPNGATYAAKVSSNGEDVVLTTRATNLASGLADDRVKVVVWRSLETLPPVTPPVTPPGTPPGTVADGASAFSATAPQRIVDTRSGLGAPSGMPTLDSSITVPLRGLYGVPANASAVALQITATEGSSVGYVSVTPSGTPTGQSSTLNLDTAGETIANLAIVPIGDDGAVTISTIAATHLIADLAGWWTPVTTPVAAGRLQPVGPSRILDTRPDSAVNSNGIKPVAGSVTELQVGGVGGVPASGVSAVSVNITLTEPEAAGYVQLAAAGTLVVGNSSTLNADRPGQVIAAAAIVPVSADGRIAIFTQPSTHLVVDVTGWITDGSHSAATAGLFIPSDVIERITDTRAPGQTKPVPGTRFDVASEGQALVGNLTITETDGAGFVQVGPAATMANGSTSAINATAFGETIANAFFVGVDNGIGVYTSNGTHIVIDVSGTLTG